MAGSRSRTWDRVAADLREPQFQEQLALHKRRENLELVRRWAPERVRRVLKTDLFEEAFGRDALADALARLYAVVVGMDVSHVVARAARPNVPDAKPVVADAHDAPFRDGAFDLIVSISTLDHLSPRDLPAALHELCRVLAPGGCLVLTLDSRHNPLHVLSNSLRRRVGRIHAERCYSMGEIRAALLGQPVTVTHATAIYHVQFPVNFLAKLAERRFGRRADPWIRGVVRASSMLAALPTRYLTGRYIALRIVRTG